MLIALLTVDAVLKKSLFRSFQRRGSSLESSQASIIKTSESLPTECNLQLSPIQKVKVSSRLLKNHTMSSTGQQSPAVSTAPLQSKTMSEHNENIIANNTTTMYVIMKHFKYFICN